MFCTKCGAKNDDNAKFCVECGSPLEHVVSSAESGFSKGTGGTVHSFTPAVSSREIPPFKMETTQAYRKQEHRKVNIIPVIITLVLVAAILFVGKSIFSSGGEKKLIKNFVKAEMAGDAKTILNMIPDDVLDGLSKETGMDLTELTDEMNDEVESAMKTINDTLGEGWSYSYDIQKMEDMSEEDIKEKEELYSEICDLDITKGKTASVEIAVKGKETETSKVLDIGIIKVKGKWYLDITSLENLL